MSVSASTSRTLHQALGDEAADEMIDRMNQMETSSADNRELIELSLGRFEDRIALQLSQFRQEVRNDIARLELKIEQRFADLLKWSLMYWIGAVISIAGLARLLR